MEKREWRENKYRSFNRAAEIVFLHEGELSRNPDDLGGVTKWGISSKQYPKLNIEQLTKEEAKEIYYKDYWEQKNYKNLPEEIAIKVFDLAVLMGEKPAVKILQRALRATGHKVTEDGILGNITVGVVYQVAEPTLVAAIRSEAAGQLRLLCQRIPKMAVFERGGVNRAYS